MKKIPATPSVRLGRLIRDALIAAVVKHDPCHRSEHLGPVRGCGRLGYVHVARELLALGVRLPAEEGRR